MEVSLKVGCLPTAVGKQPSLHTHDVMAFQEKLKSNADFHCRRCLEGEHGLFQSVLLKEVVIEPNVKLECVPKF